MRRRRGTLGRLATLTVWEFDFPTAADEAQSTLESLSSKASSPSVTATISWATSAPFVMTSDAVVDKVSDALAALHPELIETNSPRRREPSCARPSPRI